MQQKWVNAMNSVFRKGGKCSSFIESPIPVENIGSPPVMLNPITITKEINPRDYKEKACEAI
jgi:hypothetical protein